MKLTGKVVGVYKIEDIKTGSVYVGSANDIARRWSNNLAKLRKDTHGYSQLQDAWNDDPNRIKFEILELCEDDDEVLSELELFYFRYVEMIDGWTLINKQKHKAQRHRVADVSNMEKAQAGQLNGNSKLTEEQVMEILWLKENRWKHKDIAAKYRTKPSYISAIGTSKWRTVTENKRPEWLEEEVE